MFVLVNFLLKVPRGRAIKFRSSRNHPFQLKWQILDRKAQILLRFLSIFAQIFGSLLRFFAQISKISQWDYCLHLKKGYYEECYVWSPPVVVMVDI